MSSTTLGNILEKIDRPMKILHVVPTYFPALRYGGPIYSVHALCRHLVAAGHGVHVITTSVNGPKDSDVPHDRPVELDGVQVHYYRSRWFRRLFFSTDLAARLMVDIGNFDVAHLHSVFLFPTLVGARASARAGVPYVLSPRGMLVRDLIERRSTALKRAWICLVERTNLARAARIHVTSEEERRAVVDLGLALAPTSVIPNGVDAPISISPNTVSPDVRALVAQGIDILSFGRISWKKGLDRLIRSMVALPTRKLVVAGNDEDQLTPVLQNAAKELGVSSRVEFLPRQIGVVDREALFAAARVFALPSLSENFGNVITEALIRRLPVVVTNRVGAADIVEASGAGIVVGSDLKEFASALEGLLDSEDRRVAMGAAGENYAREFLSWRGIARQFETLYSEILAKHAGAHPTVTSSRAKL
jgi:glycosyltransferase involved in cell wall biosynthesis